MKSLSTRHATYTSHPCGDSGPVEMLSKERITKLAGPVKLVATQHGLMTDRPIVICCHCGDRTKALKSKYRNQLVWFCIRTGRFGWVNLKTKRAYPMERMALRGGGAKVKKLTKVPKRG